MKRSAPLQRFTPLTSRSQLRRTALPASPASRTVKHANQPKHRSAGSTIPAKVRSALAARSGGVCEVQAPGCCGIAVDPSHRKGSGMGGRKRDAAGRHHVLSNLLHACRGCHEQAIHAMPAAAYWRGWMLRNDEDPASTPVLYRGQWVLLADDGSFSPVTPTEAN